MQNTKAISIDSASTKLFYGWLLILISAIGIMLSAGSVLTFTFSVFIIPLSLEFGWSRTELSLGYSLGALCFGILQPWIGRLIHRFSARKVILPSVGFTGLLLMSLYFLSANLWHFYLIYAAIGALGAGTGMTAYVKVISHWFDRRRGLALGLTIAGFGLGASIMPSLAHALITTTDWKGAYFFLGVIVIGIAIPVVGIFLKDSPQQMGMLSDGDSPGQRALRGTEATKQGLDVSEARRTVTFWLMVIAFFLVSLAIHACIIHLVPIITDRGVDVKTAVFAASLLGITLIFARVGTGFLLDKFNAAFVGASIFAISAMGLLLLYFSSEVYYVYLAVVLIGLAFGAESDVIAYMVSRYFGLLHMSEIYGYFYAIYILGAVLGPLLMGAAYDLSGSYQSALMILTLLVLTAAGLLIKLGFMRRDKQ